VPIKEIALNECYNSCNEGKGLRVNFYKMGVEDIMIFSDVF